AVFPEGLRSKNPEGGLLPFRLGFFKLAVEEGATIVPIAISGTDKCWPLGSVLMDSSTAYFSCGDPVDASTFRTAEELRDHVWQLITDLRESHPDRRGKLKSQLVYFGGNFEVSVVVLFFSSFSFSFFF
ncbi:1-acyl-sn-glycerol-3-phosphate acyltransferase, partial [Trypanosoma cruzi]